MDLLYIFIFGGMGEQMSEKSDKRQDIVFIAADLAARIRWEREIGSPGYRRTPPKAEDPSTQVGDNKAALETLREEIGDCTRCGLHRGRSHIVFGEGLAYAALVFVGEGPGRDEDLAGRPFVGAAGQLLDRIIEAMGLNREDVYICNVVKCRPPDNRVPSADEQNICGPFVRRQLEIIEPKVVVALGSTAASYLLGRNGALGRLRGRFHELGPFRVMPTYHPAYLLRKPEGKKSVWQDMQAVMKELGLPVPPPRSQR
jgi:uracil-DNA glycosylase family 4